MVGTVGAGLGGTVRILNSATRAPDWTSLMMGDPHGMLLEDAGGSPYLGQVASAVGHALHSARAGGGPQTGRPS